MVKEGLSEKDLQGEKERVTGKVRGGGRGSRQKKQYVQRPWARRALKETQVSGTGGSGGVIYLEVDRKHREKAIILNNIWGYNY
jgi:hypothetical protein